MSSSLSYVVHPVHGISHTHTVILLHGRGSTAKEFAEDLFSLRTKESRESLQEYFPTVRWVFPDAGQRWCTAFGEERSAWFDTVSLDDLALSQDLQVPGLQDSVRLTVKTILDEVEKLDGKVERVVLGGFSQGSAVALWSLFTGADKTVDRLGAFVGLSAWMPFTREALDLVSRDWDMLALDRYRILRKGLAKMGVVETVDLEEQEQVLPKLPVYLGHGKDVCILLSTLANFTHD